MKRFSERMGIVDPAESVQVTSMDEALSNGLWNAFFATFASGNVLSASIGFSGLLGVILRRLWTEFFKFRIDDLQGSAGKVLEGIKGLYLRLPWNERYEFVEFIAENSMSKAFATECNRVLARDRSAYRFAGFHLVRVTEERDLAAVQRALDDTGIEKLRHVHRHLETSIDLMSAREKPDYRNSIKESISAVEGLVQLIVGKPGATLGQALKKIEPSIHGALEKGLTSLYGWTSDGDGIRHALMDEPSVALEDAQFMLVLCSGFVSFLTAKAVESGALNL